MHPKKDFNQVFSKYLKLCKENKNLPIDGIFNIIDYVNFKPLTYINIEAMLTQFNSISNLTMFFEKLLETYLDNNIKVNVENYNLKVNEHLAFVKFNRMNKILANKNWYKKQYNGLQNLQSGEIDENFFEQLNNNGSKENTIKNLYHFIDIFSDVVTDQNRNELSYDVEHLLQDIFNEITFKEKITQTGNFNDSYDELMNYIVTPIKKSVKKLFKNDPYQIKGIISQVKQNAVVDKNLRAYKPNVDELDINDKFHYILNDTKEYDLSSTRKTKHHL